MKIGIDGRMWDCSGIGRYTKNLVYNLLAIDKKNQYFLFTQRALDGSKNNILASCLNLKIVKVDAPIYSFKEQTSFLSVINKQNLDLMHFTHFNIPIFYNRPFVVTIHDLTPIYFPGRKHNIFFKRWAYFFVLKNALKRSAKIIAVSNHTKRDLLKNYPFLDKKKIRVIYEGIEEKFTKRTPNPKSKALNSKPYILYVGVWREHKNLKGLIRAFEIVKTKFSNLKLIIVGKPDPLYPEIKEESSKSPFKKDIIIAGYVSDDELVDFYQNASAFVFPSFYEGFGLPPLEAMASCCPVICSNAASLPEILGNAALYFNPYNIDDMAKKILKCLMDKNLREKLIETGLKQVRKYSLKKMAKETLGVYNEVSKEDL